MTVPPKVTLALVVAYLLTRAFIWWFGPPDFSEIIYSYMPYAHLWASGTRPYLDQWYEYPPATIPLFYLPHVIDTATHGYPWHFNYSEAYRGFLLLTDLVLFWIVWKTLRKLAPSLGVLAGAVLYYLLLTAKANHFIYDTMDLTFALALTLGATAAVIWPKPLVTFGRWFGLFLATALKYVNAPLAPLYALLELPVLKLPSRSKSPSVVDWAVTTVRAIWSQLPLKWWLTTGVGVGAALLVVWAVPLGMYRSSLQVSFLYHQLRGLQIDSTPAIIVRTIHAFTGSEQVIEVYKNYEITGPITTTALHLTDVIFPVALAVFLMIGAWAIWLFKTRHDRYSKLNVTQLSVWLTLGYILVFMLTAKVLSRPFLLWHIPLLAAYPFTTWRKQLLFTLPSYVMVFISLSQISNQAIGIFPLPLLVGWLRVGILIYLMIVWSLELKRLLGSPTVSR